jgi:hypothetical protein
MEVSVGLLRKLGEALFDLTENSFPFEEYLPTIHFHLFPFDQGD